MKYHYYCPICHSTKKTKAGFITHLQIHNLTLDSYNKKFNVQPNLYPCKICGKRKVKIHQQYCSNICKFSDKELNKKRARKDKNDKTMQLRCKECNKIIYDTINASGHATKHLREVHNINDTKNYLNYYIKEKILKDNRPRLQCPYCNWNTIDIENKSGQFTHHLLKKHKLTIGKFIEKYPKYSYLWKHYHYIQKRKEFLTKNNNFIECQICNKKFKYLTNSHLKTHNITQKKYKKKYGSIISINTKNILSENYKTGLGLYSPQFQFKAEQEIISYLISLNIKNIKSSVRNIISPYEIDIYLPDYKLAIEYNGLYWHSELNGKDKNYHKMKTDLCEEKGIQLIHIFEDEWVNKQTLIKNKLRHILKLNTNYKKIYARKCIIQEVDPKTKNLFLEKYHIQGKDQSSIKLGAFYNNELVAIMTLGKKRIIYNKEKHPKKDSYELIRYATNDKYILIGTAGKLLKHFIKKYNPNNILSFADKRWSTILNNNLYNNLGFSLINNGGPNYWYLVNYNERKHRFNFTKHQIINKYNGKKELSEWENMIELGYDRIWDCGNLKYELNVTDLNYV